MLQQVEVASVINGVRLQYLKVYEDDQSLRIIRPYNGQEDEFGELLTRFESPPIPINVLEDGAYGWRNNEVQKVDEILEHNEQQNSSDSPFKDKFQNLTLNKPIKNSLIEESLNSRTSSVSTLKENNDSNSKKTAIHSKYVPAFSKIFKNSSTSTANLERRKKRKSDLFNDSVNSDDDDDDDEFDDDYDEDILNGSITTQSENDLSSHLEDDDDDTDINETTMNSDSNIEFNDSISNIPNESGILVDQNFSDVNAQSQFDNYNESKYLFNPETGSSDDDDDLLLDSDFSDENNTFNSSEVQSLASPPKLKISKSLTNRRLSLDNSKSSSSRPKFRPRRSDSLNPKLVFQNATQSESPFALKPIKTVSNIEELISFNKNPSTSFEKSEIKPLNLSKSKLSELLNKTLNGSKEDPLEQFIFVSGDDATNKNEVLNLKVFLPDDKQINVKIRKSSIVFDTIGYILYKTNLKYPEILKDLKLKNLNRWCLKLIDDDGEPYEGSFGLMERKKQIASYGEDEVALVNVSETQYALNESETPMPIFEEPQASSSSTPSPSKAISQNSYYKSILPPIIDNNIKDTKTVKVQIFEYPSTTYASSYVTLEFSINDTLNEIMKKYSNWKRIDPTYYVLKAVDENFILNLNDSISSLDGNYKLEVLTKLKARTLHLRKKNILISNTLQTINSNLTPQTLTEGLLRDGVNSEIKKEMKEEKEEATQQSTSKFSSSLSKQGLSSFKNRNFSKSFSNKVEHNPGALTGQYEKFTVWRRLPMSFINRHEREFAIDGDYVYIMPKDEKIWYDTNFKTTTFHISNIKSCKISKRVPSNFKIIVNKPRGPKRYDFEALNSSEAEEIVSRLNNLMDAYKINNITSVGR